MRGVGRLALGAALLLAAMMPLATAAAPVLPPQAGGPPDHAPAWGYRALLGGPGEDWTGPGERGLVRGLLANIGNGGWAGVADDEVAWRGGPALRVGADAGIGPWRISDRQIHAFDPLSLGGVRERLAALGGLAGSSAWDNAQGRPFSAPGELVFYLNEHGLRPARFAFAGQGGGGWGGGGSGEGAVPAPSTLATLGVGLMLLATACLARGARWA